MSWLRLLKGYRILSLVVVLTCALPLCGNAEAAAPTLVWSRTINAIIDKSSPMPIQIGTGAQDVVFGAYDKNVYVLNGADGTNAPGWPQTTTNSIDSSASSGDVDGSGNPEIFIGSGIGDVKCSGGGLYSFNSDGSQRFSVKTPDNVPGPGAQCQNPAINASPALGDINRSGLADVTFGALGLKSWSFNQNGQLNFGWPFYWDDTQWGSPALADVTGDGQADAIMPGDSSPGGPVDWQGGMVRALTGFGQVIWSFFTNEIIYSSPSVGDVTGSGDFEVVFGTGNYWAHNGGASDSTKVFVLNRVGQLICSHDVGAQVLASPTLADFNGDGRLDIAFGTWQKSTAGYPNDGKVWVLDGRTCNPLPNFPISSGGNLVDGQITTADLEGNGHQDLIVPTANGIHAFDGITGAPLWTINVGIASYQNAPLITDTDGNGRLNLIVAGTEGDGKTGLVQRYEFPLGDPAVLGTNGWHMFRRDTQLTGSWTNVPLKDPPSGTKGLGYWIVAADGGVFPFGSAKPFGSAGNINLRKPMVGMASTKSGQGYWLVAADGGIFPFGDAVGYGSAANINLAKPIVGMATTPDGNGYWLVAADGGVFPFGDASGYGSASNIYLRQPIVGMTSTKSGHGYWLVAADGGIFPFGDAVGYGSAGNINLAKPMVGMATTSSGNGYWLVAADGGVFPFGDAVGYGSAGNLPLAKPIVGMASSPLGGYLFTAADGGVFTYNAAYYGSTGGLPIYKPVVGISMVGY